MTNQRHADRPELVRAKLDLARARMDVIIQEVCDEIDAKAAKNIEAAKQEAQSLRELASLVEALMKIPVVEVARSGLTMLCKVVCDLAEITERFEQTFEAFVTDHGPVLEDSAKQTLREFIKWVRAQEALMTPMWDEYVSALDRDLRESREENSEIAAEWSVVDADGLT